MPLTFDPEIAAALAPMAESGFAPPAVGEIAGRRAVWEPIIGVASTAQPIPADVSTTEHSAPRCEAPATTAFGIQFLVPPSGTRPSPSRRAGAASRPGRCRRPARTARTPRATRRSRLANPFDRR
jgi:hypothetical protein